MKNWPLLIIIVRFVRSKTGTLLSSRSHPDPARKIHTSVDAPGGWRMISGSKNLTGDIFFCVCILSDPQWGRVPEKKWSYNDLRWASLGGDHTCPSDSVHTWSSFRALVAGLNANPAGKKKSRTKAQCCMSDLWGVSVRFSEIAWWDVLWSLLPSHTRRPNSDGTLRDRKRMSWNQACPVWRLPCRPSQLWRRNPIYIRPCRNRRNKTKR